MSEVNVYMESVLWHQTIHSNGSHCHVGADCRMRHGCDFRLSNGDNLVHRVVHLSFRAGIARETNGSPLMGGIGRLVYNPEGGDDGGPFVHGWACLPDDHQMALWQQITSGLFTNCVVDLTVTPVEWDVEAAVWMIDRGPLLIESVSFCFTRPGKLEPPPQPPKAGPFGRARAG